jgi:uncharacterized membrane protein
MKCNVGSGERIVRGVVGMVLLGVGLSIGRRSWWGVLLDAAGAVALLSAAIGFCHIRKVLSDLGAARKS